MADPAVGIDLGTTFSVIAHIDRYELPRTILNSDGGATLPSVVMIDREKRVVGHEALEAAELYPDLVVRFVKREMGNQYFSREIAGQKWKPEMIQSFILKRLKEDAEKILGPFSKAVITVPAYFNDARRFATQEAGRLAELDVLDIINEPTAAALAYVQHRTETSDSRQREVILVYDLGGGTFDVTLVEITGGHLRTLATDGQVTLGGCDWDKAIIDFIADEYAKQNRGVDPRKDPGTLQMLLKIAERIKKTLSQKLDTRVILNSPYLFECTFTRDKFEEITEWLVNDTRRCTEKVREVSGLSWDQIDTVLLVGGSSRMPMIVRMLEELTGKKVTESISKDEAIAWGAALYAKAILDRRVGIAAITIGNVNAHSLGIAVAGNNDDKNGKAVKTLSVIIDANQRLPAEGTKSYSLRESSKKLKIRIFEAADLACTKGCIGVVQIHPQQPFKAGESIDVTFRYETDGRLGIYIHRKSTGEKWKQELDRVA